MVWFAWAIFLMVTFCGLAPDVHADVIITEIMYNPQSSERAPVKSEWVEIYNTADIPADVSGWYLQDEDGKTAALPADTLIPPRTAVVLIPGDQKVAAFQAAWGREFGVYPLADWAYRGGIAGLANQSDGQNEVLSLRAADGKLVDEVNFASDAPWPSVGDGGPSVYLLPGRIDAALNDDGGNWRASREKARGARAARETAGYKRGDVGSPGDVATAEEE